MSTDYRALCAELADSVELLLEMRAVDAKPMAITEDRVSRARAALAQPEPVAPTDEEIMELMPQQMRDDLAATTRAVACGLAITGACGLAITGFERDSSMKSAGAWRIIFNRHAVDHARAALAKWGHQ